MYKLAYYFLWALLYVVSLLPKCFFYAFSDFCAFLANYIFLYRKSVIDVNIARSFPNMKYGQIKQLRKRYYRYMFDIAVESIWSITASEKEICNCVSVKNPELLSDICKKHKKVVVIMGHVGNWELISGMCGRKDNRDKDSFANKNIYLSYKAAENRTFDELFVKMRMHSYKKFGNPGHVLESKKILRNILKDKNENGIYIFIADQSPLDERVVVKFLNQPTLMLTGAEYVASKLNMPVVYLGMNLQSRGKYEIEFTLIDENPSSLQRGEVTRKFAYLLQKDIFANNVNWLWSHKRWKRDFREEEIIEYKKLYNEFPDNLSGGK